MVVSGNTIYNKQGTLGKTAICDKSNKVGGAWPSAGEVVKMGRAVLGF